MKPLELAATAARALAEPGTVGVVLTVPKGGLPCGFPAPGGYRRTCGKHMQWWDERPNA